LSQLLSSSGTLYGRCFSETLNGAINLVAIEKVRQGEREREQENEKGKKLILDIQSGNR